MQQNITRVGKYGSMFDRKNDFIGKGAFGQVYRGYEIKNPENKVAIKIMKFQKKQQESAIKTQISNMLKVDSQNTVKVYAFDVIQLSQQKHYGIVMQLMEGSLKKLLSKRQNLLNQKQAIEWIWKIVQSYKVLYDKNLMHRDIKPDNILYKKGENNQIIFKLTDFGSSRQAISLIKKSMTLGKGTYEYLSPQQYKSKDKYYTNKTDVYSLGAIFFELLNGSSNTLLEMDIISFPQFQFFPQKFNQNLKSLKLSESCHEFLTKCLKQEEKDRYSWDQIFTHKIFIDAGYLKKQDIQQKERKYSYQIKNSLNNQLQIQSCQTNINFQNRQPFCSQKRKSYPIKFNKSIIDYSNQLKKYPQNIKNLLKGIKRINITPNQKGYFFKQGDVKIDKKNSNICITSQFGAHIFSNEELPIKDEQSFYFSIKATKIIQNNQIKLGIAYPDDIANNTKSSNCVCYDLHNNSLYIIPKSSYHPQPLPSNILTSFPCQLIVFLNKESNDIFIIYNNQVQLKIPLNFQMINHKNKCFAYVWIWKDSQIQFI